MLTDVELLTGWCKWHDIDLVFNLIENCVNFDLKGHATTNQTWNVLLKDKNGYQMTIDGIPIGTRYSSIDNAATLVIDYSLGKIWRSELFAINGGVTYKFPDSRIELEFELDKRGIKPYE